MPATQRPTTNDQPLLTAFITGATSGIGRACALRLARDGARIIACGRRADKLKELMQELKDHDVHSFTLDVRNRAAVNNAIATLPSGFDTPDVLINNAGLALGLEPFHECVSEKLDEMVDTNIKGLLHCTHAILPGMVARNRGHIVNLSSIAGTYPYPGGNVYGGTKAFVTQFSLNLRADLLGTRIRVTNIEPGMVETEFSLMRFQGDTARADSVYAGVEALTAEDIAEAVAWAIAQPPHVNINRIELMPVQQAPGGPQVKRES